jgi:hypothetical protein
MRGRHLRLGIVVVFACGGGPGDASSEGLTTAADTGGPTGMEPTSTSAGSTSVTTQGASGETTEASGSGETTTMTPTSDGSTTGDSTTGGPDPAGPCPAFAPPAGEVIAVTPEQAGDLANIVAGAATGTTISLADGTYAVTTLLHFTTPGVTLRSASGDRDAVVLDANYAVGEIALVGASDVTIADVTLARAFYHPIHVTGAAGADTEGMRIYNVKVIDPGQQAIKVNPSPEGFYSDRGSVACSWIELTDAGRPQIKDNCYTGGVDAHAAWGWEIRDNFIKGFWCEAGLSEHAVHFWVTGRDTLVERNVIVDCARGIGFGLGEMGNGNSRAYADDPCPGKSYLGHIDGIIRNNTVWAASPGMFASQAGFDSGVALEQACGAQVYHNTVVSLQQPFTAMEYRWPNTSAIFTNNLLTHALKERDGATAAQAVNLVDAGLEHFVDANAGDLHLAPGSAAIGAGEALAAGLADEDFEGDARDAMPDVGADERVR